MSVKNKKIEEERSVVEEQEKHPADMSEENVQRTSQIDLDALRSEIDGVLKERDTAVNMLKQVSADFDNYKKRNAQIRIETLDDARREVVAAILPAFDNLGRALDASKNGESGALVTGVEMVVKQFQKTLGDLGVNEIESGQGIPFDPTLHDAVVTVPADDEHADNTVFDTLQKGYKLGGRVIRYAMVRVAKSE